MQIDCYIPDGLPLGEAAAAARAVEEAGFAGMWVTESTSSMRMGGGTSATGRTSCSPAVTPPP